MADRMTMLLAALLAACSGTDEPAPSEPTPTHEPAPASEDEASADEAPPEADEGEPAWRRMAARAPTDRLAQADRALEPLDAAARAAVERVLNDMAARGLGAEALGQAGQLAYQNANIAPDPTWEGSGTAPAPHALHVAGVAVLAGMASQSAREHPEDAQTIAHRVCQMPMPRFSNSGGQADDTPDRHAIIADVIGVLPAGAERPSPICPGGQPPG